MHACVNAKSAMLQYKQVPQETGHACRHALHGLLTESATMLFHWKSCWSTLSHDLCQGPLKWAPCCKQAWAMEMEADASAILQALAGPFSTARPAL